MLWLAARQEVPVQLVVVKLVTVTKPETSGYVCGGAVSQNFPVVQKKAHSTGKRRTARVRAVKGGGKLLSGAGSEQPAERLESTD